MQILRAWNMGTDGWFLQTGSVFVFIQNTLIFHTYIHFKTLISLFKSFHEFLRKTHFSNRHLCVRQRILGRDGNTPFREGRRRERGGGGVNHKTTKTTDISKQHSKQAKTGKVERNYKTFADQVHKSGTYIYLYMWIILKFLLLSVDWSTGLKLNHVQSNLVTLILTFASNFF